MKKTAAQDHIHNEPGDADSITSETSQQEQAASARTETPSGTFGGRPLPAWTLRYPATERATVAMYGVDTGKFPRAHEANLRIVEVSVAFDKVLKDKNLIYGRHLQPIWEELIYTAIGDVEVAPHPPEYYGGNFSEESVAAALEDFERSKIVLPARPTDEVEVQENWIDMYPPAYQPIIREWGVPTVRGSVVDRYHRRLIAAVPDGCIDQNILRAASCTALLGLIPQSFWASYSADPDDDEPDTEFDMTHHHDWDLAARYLSDYNDVDRPIVEEFGRPEYEHYAAHGFNQAVIGIAKARRAIDSNADLSEVMAAARPVLWLLFFGEDKMSS